MGKKMRFMALHGTFGSKQNYSVQLAPFVKELERDGTAEFEFIQGPEYTPEPPGFEGYFGPPPHFRFLDDGNLAAKAMVERIRDFPIEQTPEDALRALVPDGMDRNAPVPTHRALLDWVYSEMDRLGDIEGVLGYSEGALVAGSLLLEDQRRVEEEGAARRLKAGIFFFGWPPLSRTGAVVLADEREERIRVPTLHVIGGTDPYLDGSKALYNVCDPETATLFDHGRGHTLPREPRTIGELGGTVRQLVQRSAAVC